MFLRQKQRSKQSSLITYYRKPIADIKFKFKVHTDNVIQENSLRSMSYYGLQKVCYGNIL